MQLSEWLETEILSGSLSADEKVYSQYQLADMFNINPATAAKGLSILAERNTIYKKRGLGMFVSPQANEIILKKRTEETLKSLVTELIREANHLSISEEELIHMIKEERQQSREDK